MLHRTPAAHTFASEADHDYEIRCAIGRCAAGAGDVGEILAAVAGVRHGDHEGWYAAWRTLGERSLAIAAAAAAGDHRVSAADAYLRASAYFAVALNAVAELPGTDRLDSTFARVREAWDGFVTTTEVDVARVRIPYEGRHLTGFLFRPATPNGATLVAVNGSDGSLASVWSACVHPGLRRGYAVLVFDGPGQQSELYEHRSFFRPDWENVLTPVLDALERVDGVDPARVGVQGISQGGYWVARALAFEHRFAAAVLDPGVVDVATSWVEHIPRGMVRTLDAGESERFDREMAFGMRFSAGTARTWSFRARPYGTTGYAETLAEVRRYRVADLVPRITTPMLVLSPEGEEFWPGQSEELARLAPDVATLVSFTAQEGGDGHCQPLAPALAAQRTFDWLDERLLGARA